MEANRGAGAQSLPVNRLVVGSIPTRGEEIFIYVYIFISSLWCRGGSAALSSATQHAMPPEIGRKWGTECLNTRFPYPAVCGIQREVEKKKKKNMWFYIFELKSFIWIKLCWPSNTYWRGNFQINFFLPIEYLGQ